MSKSDKPLHDLLKTHHPELFDTKTGRLKSNFISDMFGCARQNVHDIFFKRHTINYVFAKKLINYSNEKKGEHEKLTLDILDPFITR